MKTRSMTGTIAAALAGLALMASPALAQDAPGDSPSQATPEVPATSQPPAVGQQADLAKVRARVEVLLSGYEYFPTRADLDAVASADVMAPLLRELAQREGERPSLRVRAVDALGFYEDAATQSFLLELAARPTEGVPKKQLRVARSMRHHAITSYARATGERALAGLEPLLADEDLQIRLTVISALGKHGGAPGEAKLRELAAADNDPITARELRKHLGE